MKTKLNTAGGIRTSKQALTYLAMVKETLAEDWLNPDMFRFGASTLVNHLVMRIAMQVDGDYQGSKYFRWSAQRAVTRTSHKIRLHEIRP